MAGPPPGALLVGVRQVVVAVLLVVVDFLHGRSAPDALLVGVRQVVVAVLLVVVDFLHGRSAPLRPRRRRPTGCRRCALGNGRLPTWPVRPLAPYLSASDRLSSLSSC